MEVFLEYIKCAFCLQFILDEVPARSSADMLLWVPWTGLCLWCLLLSPAGGRNSQEMLMVQFSCLAWLASLGAFPLPAPRCHIPRGPSGVTASCCAGRTSRLGHFPVLEPWRDCSRSVPFSEWPHLHGATESSRKIPPRSVSAAFTWIPLWPLNQSVPPLLGIWTFQGWWLHLFSGRGREFWNQKP